MESTQEKAVATILLAIALLMPVTAEAAPLTNLTKARMDMCSSYRTRVTTFISYHRDLVRQADSLHSLINYQGASSSPNYARLVMWYEGTVAVRDAYYSFILRETSLFSSTCGVIQ